MSTFGSAVYIVICLHNQGGMSHGVYNTFSFDISTFINDFVLYLYCLVSFCALKYRTVVYILFVYRWCITLLHSYVDWWYKLFVYCV